MIMKLKIQRPGPKVAVEPVKKEKVFIYTVRNVVHYNIEEQNEIHE
jgi:hypothetical protein